LIFAITRAGLVVERAALNPNTLRPVVGDHSPGTRLLHDHLLAHLYARLIGPVESQLRGRRHLFLIPHGPLHYTPFMALRRADGEYLLRAGGPAITLAPSTTILLHNCLARPPSQAVERLALGYNDRGPDQLHHAELEAQRVAALIGGRAWTGPAAKSQALLQVGPQLRWLHFAGHAVFNPDEPLASLLRLGDGDELTARTIIEHFDLAAELVTLSACTSGLSQVVPGDELLGLQRAFLYAGAPTVVCTLWEAADLASLLVMEHFYAALAAGRPAGEALRDAQVTLRQMTVGEVRRRLTSQPGNIAAIRQPLDHKPLVDTLSVGELTLIMDEDESVQPFADPFYWAPFMLIGRPD
jgi:CHAT domain-containing protein